jgi:hypothetical protein
MAEYYHVSPSENKDDILEGGLDPDTPSNGWGDPEDEKYEDMDDAEFEEKFHQPMRRVHFAAGIDDARKWATQVELTQGDTTKMSLFKVDTKGLPLIQKTSDIGLVDTYTPKYVDPYRITHVEDFYPHDYN